MEAGKVRPESTVLHLGCGLDTRVYRIDPRPKVRWFDVDFPDVIALREQLYPERDGYRRIGSSVTDVAWLDAIPGDTPVLVVAEGLMMYLHEKDGTALLRRITEQFPSGQLSGKAPSNTAARSWASFNHSPGFDTTVLTIAPKPSLPARFRRPRRQPISTEAAIDHRSRHNSPRLTQRPTPTRGSDAARWTLRGKATEISVQRVGPRDG